MDNTENLGAVTAAAAAKDRAKSQEDRIQALEAQVQMLTMLAQHHIKMIGRLCERGGQQ